MNHLKLDRFAKFAWLVLVYNILVILWGAVVRATGSGAGCGDHWPLCNGAVVPAVEQTATAIEFTHRVMSGLVLVFVVISLVWARRIFPRGHRVRLGVYLVAGFTILESLVGAGLVLFGLTAMNTSDIRALVVAIHLVNTMLLVAALTLTAWWATGAPAPRSLGYGVTPWLLLAGAIGMLGLGATGAITALGDTLFPVSSLEEGLRQDLDPAAHFLVQLRIVHPALSILWMMVVVAATAGVRIRSQERVIRWLSAAVLELYVIQVVIGVINVLLLAPVWMQVVHLLVTNLIWVAYVMMMNEGMSLQPYPPPAQKKK